MWAEDAFSAKDVASTRRTSALNFGVSSNHDSSFCVGRATSVLQRLLELGVPYLGDNSTRNPDQYEERSGGGRADNRFE
jgi:hypothetical protein